MLASFAMANVAIAQGGWPQLSIADIEPCRPQIVQFRQMEQAYFRSQISEYCTAGAQYYSAQNCSTIQTWMNEKNQLNDMAWYYQGKSSCGGGDYPLRLFHRFQGLAEHLEVLPRGVRAILLESE